MQNIISLQPNNKKLSTYWLIQSVGALALSGFFAIFLVLARAPAVSKLLPYKDFFKTTLTIHVNLSVLIWLTSMVCMIFATHTKNIRAGYAGLIISAFGSVIIACGIFDISAEAYLNNYIPMLDSRIFLAGIGIYFAGFIIGSFQALRFDVENRIIKYFGLSSFLIIMIAFVTLLLAWANLESEGNKGIYNFADYYDRLFWGFGHIIQFLYTNGMMIAAFILVFSKGDYIISRSTLKGQISCFVLNLVFAATGIFIILKYDVSSYEYMAYYTRQMVMFNGITPLIAFILILPALIKNYSALSVSKPQRNALISAIILFGAGGIISMFINGVNTIIPAHYHGSIIGISLSLMAFCYYIIPKLGFREIKGWMANVQPILYGFGQLLHIIGFALSGGYGAMRKTPGVELPTQAKVYMGLMGLGGMISIIGGLFFVIIIFITLTRTKEQ